jgi:hypothetical protein
MSRSGYNEDLGSDDQLAYGRWRAQVMSAIRGQRGQAFLREVATLMDAMPVRELITDQLVRADGACCTIGVVCKARGLPTERIDYECPEEVGRAVGIAHQMAAEIEFLNDEWCRSETPEQRWKRMRQWIGENILSD